MTNEQAQKVLDELQGVRPEKLNGEAKRLFEAIMKMADERDEAYKIIDLMSEQLTTPIHNKEWVKEYYKKITKEL